MSTYAVFGMTRRRALEGVRARTEAVDYKTRKGISVEEWEARCQTEADQVMESARVIQLSEKFDAPQYAEQFLKIAEKEGGRSLQIRVHCWTGEFDPMTHKKIMKWVGYGSPEEMVIRRKVGYKEQAIAPSDEAEA